MALIRKPPEEKDGLAILRVVVGVGAVAIVMGIAVLQFVKCTRRKLFQYDLDQSPTLNSCEYDSIRRYSVILPFTATRV